MKRHPALQPLSREHHEALIVAQLLKTDVPAYKGLPADKPGRVRYAVAFYHHHLISHFNKEEAILEKTKSVHPQVTALAEEIFAEHRTLQQKFMLLDAEKSTENELNELGVLLYGHIRKEERLLFPMIQQYCTGEMLNSL